MIKTSEDLKQIAMTQATTIDMPDGTQTASVQDVATIYGILYGALLAINGGADRLSAENTAANIGMMLLPEDCLCVQTISRRLDRALMVMDKEART